MQDAVSYYDTWVSSYHPTVTHPSPHLTCALCGQPVNVETDVIRLLRKLGAGIQALADLDDIFPSCCHIPKGLFLSWRRSVEGNMKRMPAISSLSKPTTSISPSTVAPWHVSIVPRRSAFLTLFPSDKPVFRRYVLCRAKESRIAVRGVFL